MTVTVLFIVCILFTIFFSMVDMGFEALLSLLLTAIVAFVIIFT